MHDGSTPKGYHKDDFADAWERYLPSDAPQTPSTPSSKCNNATNRINIDDSADFESATAPTCGVIENEEIPNKNGPCGVVALSKQGEGETGYEKDPSGPGCTCLECGGHFGTVAGWKAHIAQDRCEQVEAAD
jgi:hypothetical protein